MKSANVVQLCRGLDGWYVVCPLLSVKPKEMSKTWVQVDRDDKNRTVDFGPTSAKILGFPKLKPGEGPKRVEITAKFVD